MIPEMGCEIDETAFAERISKLDDAQQMMLRHLILIVVDIIENPSLPAALLHAVPANDKNASLKIMAHCMSVDSDAVDGMLTAFVVARTSRVIAEAAEEKSDSQPQQVH